MKGIKEAAIRVAKMETALGKLHVLRSKKKLPEHSAAWIHELRHLPRTCPTWWLNLQARRAMIDILQHSQSPVLPFDSNTVLLPHHVSTLITPHLREWTKWSKPNDVTFGPVEDTLGIFHQVEKNFYECVVEIARKEVSNELHWLRVRRSIQK